MLLETLFNLEYAVGVDFESCADLLELLGRFDRNLLLHSFDEEDLLRDNLRHLLDLILQVVNFLLERFLNFLSE